MEPCSSSMKYSLASVFFYSIGKLDLSLAAGDVLAQLTVTHGFEVIEEVP